MLLTKSFAALRVGDTGGESGDMEFSWQRAWSQYTISTLRLKLLHRRDLLV